MLVSMSFLGVGCWYFFIRVSSSLLYHFIPYYFHFISLFWNSHGCHSEYRRVDPEAEETEAGSQEQGLTDLGQDNGRDHISNDQQRLNTKQRLKYRIQCNQYGNTTQTGRTQPSEEAGHLNSLIPQGIFSEWSHAMYKVKYIPQVFLWRTPLSCFQNTYDIKTIETLSVWVVQVQASSLQIEFDWLQLSCKMRKTIKGPLIKIVLIREWCWENICTQHFHLK